MILPKKTKINYQNRTLKKKKFKNKFYKLTKRNNIRLSKKKGGASLDKVNYSIGKNFYNCSGTVNEVKINKLRKKPTPEHTILNTLDVKDYNKGDFIQYDNIFLLCKELKKDNVIFEIYNNKPDDIKVKFEAKKKSGDEEDRTGDGTTNGNNEEDEEDGPKPGPITTYYYDKLKLNDPKEGKGLDKKTIPLLNANMKKVLLELDNYDTNVSEKDRIIKIETQELETTNIVEKQMLPEEYLFNLKKSSPFYEKDDPKETLEEIISCFYKGGTKKEDVDKGIAQLKNKAQTELKKLQPK